VTIARLQEGFYGIELLRDALDWVEAVNSKNYLATLQTTAIE
jgi:hypothetical protein